KESCFAGFSACGGSRKRHLPFRRSAILAELFLSFSAEPLSGRLPSSSPSAPPQAAFLHSPAGGESRPNTLFPGNSGTGPQTAALPAREVSPHNLHRFRKSLWDNAPYPFCHLPLMALTPLPKERAAAS